MATTRYKTVKTIADISLIGVRVDLEHTDGAVTGVTLSDLSGVNGADAAKLIVRKKDWGFEVLVPEPPKMVDRWRLAFDLKGIKVDELFAAEDLARVRWKDLTGADTFAAPEGTIVKVQAPEADPVSDKADHLPPF